MLKPSDLAAENLNLRRQLDAARVEIGGLRHARDVATRTAVWGARPPDVSAPIARAESAQSYTRRTAREAGGDRPCSARPALKRYL